VAGWSGRRLVLLASVGLGALFLLTGAGGYPHSMVGGVGEARSNTFPPSLALVALGTWQFALALLVRPAIDRWLDRPRAWAAVVAANGLAMTVFLWHLTALVIVAAVALPAGWMPQPAVGSSAWWAWRPVWIAVLAVALVPLVAVFARVELRRITAPAPSAVRAAVAAALVAVGMAFLARKGFVHFPVVGLGAVAAGWAVLRRA
jgi:magnesium-transporting ATPase (P-type)